MTRYSCLTMFPIRSIYALGIFTSLNQGPKSYSLYVHNL